jgi:hypothetical protein
MHESQQRREMRKGEVAVQVAAILATAGLQAWAIWVTLPPQQRYWIRLRAMDTCRRIAGRVAWSEGHAGMGEELQTGRKPVRYLGAWGLGLLRDAAVGELERMRP